MKIGILTFHRPINYGAFLQSYCLSNMLKKQFPGSEVEIIDYIAPKEHKKIYLDILRELKYYGVDACLKSIRKIRVFHRSLQYLPLSKKKLIGTNLEELFSFIDQNYDMLVIGSDAIFNWNQTDYPTAYIPQYSFHIPVFSYAASVHGLKFYEVEREKISDCADVFSKMKFIGVRDTNTEKFVSYCNENVIPIHCCDPTFLFRRIDLPTSLAVTDRVEKKYHLSAKAPYIVLMLADNELSARITKKYKGNYRIVALFKPSAYADIYIHDADPFEWAQILKNAALVVTSYFHGTLLSLVQNTPAIVVDCAGMENGIYQSKLYDVVVERLKLADLYCTKSDITSGYFDFDAILQRADRLLAGEYSQAIQSSVDQEMKHFECFEAVVSQTIKEGG